MSSFVKQAIRQAVILDIETLGLQRGVGIHEVALWIGDEDLTAVAYPEPHQVDITTTLEQDITSLASRKSDVYLLKKFPDWESVLRRIVMAEASGLPPDATPSQILDALRKMDSWLAEQLVKHQELWTLTKAPDIEELKRRVIDELHINLTDAGESLGIKSKVEVGRNVPIPELLAAIREEIEGKTVWIANVEFESKQFGALLGTYGPEAWDKWKSILETRNPASPAPFHPTGKAYMLARMKGLRTGDWSDIWRVVKNEIVSPTPGTKVRDILDLVKSLKSRAYNLGLANKEIANLGNTVDVVYRLIGAAKGDVQKALFREAHTAASDVKVSEKYILETMLEWHSILDDLERNKLGATQVKSLDEIANFMRLAEAVNTPLQVEAAFKRLLRAVRDIEEKGSSVQFSHIEEYWQEQLDSEGRKVNIPRERVIRKSFNSLEEVVSWLEKRKAYPEANLKKIAEEVEKHMHLGDAAEYVAEQSEAIRSSLLDKIDIDNLAGVRGRRPLINAPFVLLENMTPRKFLKGTMWGLGALALVGGLIGSLEEDTSGPIEPAVFSYTYPQYLAATNQVEQPYVSQESRQASVLSKASLESLAWAAPGDEVSLETVTGWKSYFTFGARSIDPGRVANLGLFADKSYYSLDFDTRDIEVEDADTVLIPMGGKKIAVRLSGIDSPEIAHDQNPAQPLAYKSKEALENILSQYKRISVIVGGENLSKGRLVGILAAGNTNLNQLLIQRGAAANLNYSGEAIMSPTILTRMEERARMSSKGIWSLPYYRTLAAQTPKKYRPTFNQIARARETNNKMLLELEQRMRRATYERSEELDNRYKKEYSIYRRALSEAVKRRANDTDKQLSKYEIAAAQREAFKYTMFGNHVRHHEM